MNNIEFSVISNRAKTKFKIKWTMNFCGELIEKVLGTREFQSREEAQKYIDDNKENLIQTMRKSISRIVINIKEEKREEKVKGEEEQMSIEEMPVLEQESKENNMPELIVEPVVVVEQPEESAVEEETTEETLEKKEPVEQSEEVPTEGIAVEQPEESAVEEEIEEVENVDEDTEETEETSELDNEETAEDTNEKEVIAVVETKKRNIPIKVLALILAFALGGSAVYWYYRLVNKNKEPEQPGIENPSDNLEEETLTTEEFETLAANFIKTLQDKNLNVTTEDIMKFVSVVNIDRLVVENPELASELFQSYTKEQYVQDAANIIGRTCAYNAKVFNDEKNTENFIRISDSLYGEQKQQLQIIESYVDRIALVYNDAEQVNAIVSELSARLMAGDLQNLDYGVQFGMQVSIELIRSYMAKDALTDANRDVLTEVTRLDVTEIMNMYDNVNGLGTTKTLN